MSEIGLIGKKIGMTREFFKTGQSVPVTVLKVEKGRVIQLINEQHGYLYIQHHLWVKFSASLYYHFDIIHK